MNEFKIHQRYFAKLKQKADNRHKEVEGKENQEPLRTISPDRTQRKRRSTMEAFLSTPSSMEDESPVESREVVAAETDARLLELTVKKVEEKPVPITNGTVSTVINGQAISENGSQNGTYKYDSAQKIFTAHQPKTPFIKKKIKISNSTANHTKADIPGERTSEEKRAKDESSNCVALVCPESVHPDGNSEEVMEVENIVSSPAVVDSGSKDVTECQKSETGELLFVEKPSTDENVHVEVTAPQKKQFPATLPPASSTAPTVSGTGVKQAAKHDKVAGRKAKVEHLEMQNQIPHVNLTKLQRSFIAASPKITKDDISKTEDVSVMDKEEKSNLFTSVSAVAACESKTALPQPPCGQAQDQLSERETIPCQKTVSVSQPALLSEVSDLCSMSSYMRCAANTGLNSSVTPVTLGYL